MFRIDKSFLNRFHSELPLVSMAQGRAAAARELRQARRRRVGEAETAVAGGAGAGAGGGAGGGHRGSAKAIHGGKTTINFYLAVLPTYIYIYT